MALTPGTRLGVYEVSAQIGEGGMGQVFRARDTKLNRDVALKVLPEPFANDPDRLSRFTREAQTLASLNHPNIAHIHGLEESGGVRALVMELVEGDDLSQRIARGAIPIDEALLIAKQIAEALEAAHEQGIIHRDLKPANIKVRPDGTVKVLDFGLAKAMDPPGASPKVSQSPTITSPGMMTAAGVILGTAAYMSPEQARGQTVDKRTDIWAFGCVFYEMLTARSAFASETVSDTIAALLAREPDWTTLPATTPPSLRRLLRRCVDRDPKRRLQSIGEARVQLEDLIDGRTEEAITTPAMARPHRTLGIAGLAVGALAGAAILASLVATRLRLPAVEPSVQFSLPTDRTAYAGFPRVSPDSSAIVYPAADASGRRQLWLRRLDSEETKPLAGTEDALYAFWSPDAKWVGFYAQQKLKKISWEGGSPQTITSLPAFDGTAAWSGTGEILYAPGNRTALFRVPDSGGASRQVTTLDESLGENSHRMVRFLPDGTHFLFSARSANRDNNAMYFGSLASGEIRRLAPIQSNVAYVPPGEGHAATLLFVRDGGLYQQPFDGATLSGEPVRLMDVAYRAIGLQGFFDVSMDGRVLVSRAPSATEQRLTWFDRKGTSVGTIGPVGEYLQPKISPDGNRVLFNRPDENGGNRDVWVLEAGRSVAARLTTDPANEWSPLWSPDGRRVLFASDRNGHQVGSTWEKISMDPGAGERPVEGLPSWANPEDLSTDGKWIAFSNGATHGDIWIAPYLGATKSFRFFDSGFEDRIPQFSPDGQWIAYHSNESGRFEVYVRPFAGAPAESGRKTQLSLQGGFFATWSRDGEELFYLGPDAKLYVVPMRDFRRSSTIPTPQPLFTTCPGNTPMGSATEASGFDVSPDGQRFLFVCSNESQDKLTVTVNWRARR